MSTHSSNREQHPTVDNAGGAPSLPSDQDASGRSFGDEELAAVRAVLESGVLTSTKGSEVKGLEADFAGLLGTRHAIAASSGTAAIHAAVAALDPEPGDEIVTTAITDMGAIAPILYQGAVPVFADVDPRNGNVTAATIERCLSDRTRAVVVTHLFGCPAAMDDIVALADTHGIPIIEDCAQAFLARTGGHLVGTLGRLGCFSLQQGKHVTTGEGGIVVTDDDALARRMRLFVNKGWPYGEQGPDHEFLAPNYRMTELHGAVGRAQLRKLPAGVDTRIRLADRLNAELGDIPGIDVPVPYPGDVHTYWRYCLAVDPGLVAGGPGALAAALGEQGIASAPRYIQKPAFRCAVIAEQRTFGDSRFPFTLARPEAVDYSTERFPGTFAMLERALVLPWNERYLPAHVDQLARVVGDATRALEGVR
jgi:perosamine synthetase